MKRRNNALIARRDLTMASVIEPEPERLTRAPGWAARTPVYRVTVAAIEILDHGQPWHDVRAEIATPITIEVRSTRGYYRARVQIGGAWSTITTGGSDSQDHYGPGSAHPMIAAAINEAFANAGIGFFLDGQRQGYEDHFPALDGQYRAIVQALHKEGNSYGRVRVIGGVL